MDCTGEGALAMPEQFRLEQVVGNRAAVDRHERPVGPVPVGVDHPGHQLLARAALAVDQHGQARGCGLFGGLQRLEQLGVVAERALEDEAAFDQRLAPLAPRQVASSRLGGGRTDEAFLVRKLHHLVAQRPGLP